MGKVYNWGIIGLGKIAQKFAEDLAGLPNARLQAVASRSAERAAAFAQKNGAAYSYGTYQDILSCPELDVVYIATPHHLHYECTLLCLEAGIPVLCEKPLAMNARQAEHMITFARDHNTFLMEALWTRFLPTTKAILEMIQSGQIGQVLSIKADFGFRAPFEAATRLFDPALGGGSLLDIGIYPVFLSWLILGQPARIKAMARLGPTGVDEECGVLLQYDDGRMAHLHSTFLAHTKTEAFLYGESGTIHIHSRWHEPSSFTLLREGHRPQDHRFQYTGHGYYFEAEEVMKCLAEGRQESSLLPGSFSLSLSRLLDDIRREAGIHYTYDNH